MSSPKVTRYNTAVGSTRLSLTKLRMASPHPLLGNATAIRFGRYSTELAKMIGITPDWLTFSGM